MVTQHCSNIFTHQFLGEKAKYAFGSRIRGLNDALLVDSDDGVVDFIAHGPDPLRLGQLLENLRLPLKVLLGAPATR